MRRRRTAAFEIIAAGLLLALVPLLADGSFVAGAISISGFLLLAIGLRLFWRQQRWKSTEPPASAPGETEAPEQSRPGSAADPERR